MFKSNGKGIFLAILTAFVSGFSIFLNKFAISGLDATAFAFAKNLFVAALLAAIIIALKDRQLLSNLARKNWLQLATIGLIGGSIPFLLFFHALQQATAQNAAFLHKTLFIWATLFAIIFLKERINKQFLAGAALLATSIILIFNINIFSFGIPEAMALTATFLWAIENIYAKKVMFSSNLTPRLIAFGRMGFGALFILPVLLITQTHTQLLTLTFENIFWITLTGTLLLAYVSFWYPALKHTKVSTATSIILLGLPITALLNTNFTSATLSPPQALGYAIMLAGLILISSTSFIFSGLKKQPSPTNHGAPDA